MSHPHCDPCLDATASITHKNGPLELQAVVSTACVNNQNRPFELVVTASNGDKIRKYLIGVPFGRATLSQAKALLETTQVYVCKTCRKPTIHMHQCFSCVQTQIQSLVTH